MLLTQNVWDYVTSLEEQPVNVAPATPQRGVVVVVVGLVLTLEKRR